MAKKHLKKCSISLVIRKCKSKGSQDSTLHSWLRSKTQATANAGEYVGEGVYSSIAGGSTNLYNLSGNYSGSFSEN